MMKYLLKWLGLDAPGARVNLRPRRTVQLSCPADAAYDRCVGAIERVLGANVYVDDRAAGFIEAGFGLVNNERVRCSLERFDDAHTDVLIEAVFPAGASVPERSRAVDALAAYLETETLP